ncbi:hypothetical protein FO519_005283 [Halicephalobus sp. NKZ332]|nr:hypothetical protein FO519_005283 [Halicephalobus sp. NKZ332]
MNANGLQVTYRDIVTFIDIGEQILDINSVDDLSKIIKDEDPILYDKLELTWNNFKAGFTQLDDESQKFLSWMPRMLSGFLLAFGLFAIANSVPLPKSPQSTESELQTLAMAKAEEGSPNLRKILYPTYVREPFGTDFYTNLDVGASAHGKWGPMYRYNDLFDRSMRSSFSSEQEESELFGQQIPEVDLDSLTYSVNSNHLPFVPFYSGIGKGR